MGRVKGSGRGGILAPTLRVAISCISHLPVIKSKMMATRQQYERKQTANFACPKYACTTG